MRVLVTGAAGQLGRNVCKLLGESRISFTAVDKVPDIGPDYAVQVIDLLDLPRCKDVMEGVDVLLHFANHANWHGGDPATVYAENVTMNINLFQSAYDAGCSRIIFSSSIQVLNGMLPVHDREEQEILLPYLPLDAASPAIPRNTYALSKHASEKMLQYYSSVYGITTIAFRFPWLLDVDLMQKCYEEGGIQRGNCFDGYAYLPIYSAAEACIKAIYAELHGYHQYFLAAKDNIEQRSTDDVIKEQLSHIPQKQSMKVLHSLVDCSSAAIDLGWSQPQSLTESLNKYAAFA